MYNFLSKTIFLLFIASLFIAPVVIALMIVGYPVSYFGQAAGALGVIWDALVIFGIFNC